MKASRTVLSTGIFAVTLALVLAAVPAAAAKAPPAGAVDINSATQAQLEAVNGIGAATAKKIIAGRPYKTLDDLAKAGIPAKTIEKLKPLLAVGPAAPAAPAPPPAAAAAPPAAPAAAAPASAPAAKPAVVEPRTTKPVAPSAVTAQVPPVKGMVWVNTSSKVFHREGDEWYGKTKHGKFMTEEDAVKAGFHASKEKPKK